MEESDGFGPAMTGGGRGDRGQVVAREHAPPGTEPHEQYGPVIRGGRRREGSSHGALRLVAVAVSAVALVGAVGGAGLALYLSGKIQRVDVGGLNGNPLDELNVLAVGSDSREGFTPEQLKALGTETVEGRRTDTIFLLSSSGDKAAMLSFPRDLFVTRCDGTRGRINGAYTSGGPTCLAETVGRLTGIALDDYIEVNLFGFSRIVDAAGGVPIYLDRPLVDRAAGVELPAGWVVLDGRSALGYVRARNVDGNADLGRIMRQQHFLKALGHKVISPNTLVNAPRLFRMAAAAGSSLTADQGLGPMDLMRIMRGARGLAGGRLAVYTVPAHPRRIGGADVLVPDKKAAEALFAQFRDGSILRGT